jgi:hypothetical protein
MTKQTTFIENDGRTFVFTFDGVQTRVCMRNGSPVFSVYDGTMCGYSRCVPASEKLVAHAFEFHRNCVKEAANTFRCEVEYRFESICDVVRIVWGAGRFSQCIRAGSNHDADLPEAVISAARKWAGWDK